MKINERLLYLTFAAGAVIGAYLQEKYLVYKAEKLQERLYDALEKQQLARRSASLGEQVGAAKAQAAGFSLN